jgi:predicted nuclease of predicted toxin-antitoxin system
MRVLLDECLPRQLGRRLPGHEVRTVPEAGWAGIRNGTLLRLAQADFDVFVTIDKNLPFQQNLRSFSLGVIILDAPDSKLGSLEPLMENVLKALSIVQPGEVIRVTA